MTMVTEQKKGGIKSFKDALRQKEIFDISDKKMKKIQEFIVHFPVGQPAVFSDQGTDPTCASHAMGKVLVEILNKYDLDCSQDKIIDDFISLVQPDKQPVTINKFNFTNIDLKFWEGNDEKTAEERKVTLVVQHQVTKNKTKASFFFPSTNLLETWKTWKPAMDKKQLENYNTKILAVYQPTSAKYLSHAVFVQDFIHRLGPNDYIFKCINSWGEQSKPELEIMSKDILALYYVTLIELAPGENLVQAGAAPNLDKSEELKKVHTYYDEY